MIDFKGFKKVAQDQKTTTLRHEKGHEVKIVHGALDKRTRQALAKIPVREEEHAPEPENKKLDVARRYAEGGTVEEEKNQSLPEDAPAQPAQAPVVINVGQAAAAPEAPAPADQVPPEAPAPTTAQSVGQTIGSGLKEAFNTSPIGLGLQAAGAALPYVKEGAQGVASGLSGKPIEAPQERAPAAEEPKAENLTNFEPPKPAGAPEAAPTVPQQAVPDLRQPPADTSQQDMQRATQDFQASRARWEKEHKELFDDLKNSHVDMDKLAGKQTTARILSTIGLVLGNLTGLFAPGMIAKHLQREIDQDVKRQQAEIGKKQTLLEEHLKEFGNIKDASDAVRMNLATAAQAQLAKSQSFKDNADAQQTYLQLDQYRKSLADQLSIKQAVKSGANSPTVRAAAVQYLVPEKHQAEAFKELTRVENAAAAEKNISDMFQKAAQENTIAGRAAHLGFEPGVVDALKANIMPVIKDNEGRVNEQEIRIVNGLIPAPGDSDKKIAEKLDGLTKFLRAKQASPLLGSFGVPVPKLGPQVQPIPKPAGWKR